MAVLGGAPDSADETASLENVLDLTRRICARLGKEPDVNLAELSGKVDKLTLCHGEIRVRGEENRSRAR